MPIRPENRNRYGPDWPEFSRSIRFDRAGGRCECHGECGRGTHHGRCPNEHDAPAYGTGSKVVLTVAHLCHTPECREHVKAMCQGCHLHYDRDHHRETRERTRRDAAAAAGQTALALSPGGHMTDRCPHVDFAAHVDESRLYNDENADENQPPDSLAVDVTIVCATCGRHVLFEGPIGAAIGRGAPPRVSVDGRELRAAAHMGNNDTPLAGFTVGVV